MADWKKCEDCRHTVRKQGHLWVCNQKDRYEVKNGETWTRCNQFELKQEEEEK